MGAHQSTPIEKCLTTAVGGIVDLVAFPSKLLYQSQDVNPYNQDIQVHPVAVTYPTIVDQVSAIVQCATSKNGYTLQARGGGRSYGNYGLGGGDTTTIVVDLRNFQAFSMNTNTWEATIGGGTRLETVMRNLLEHGNRAIAHGTCPDVGIGGNATMGGLGPTSRMWGSAMDHVIEYEVVLANATVVKASATQFPDIFWAMKGAENSFRIVTNFKVLTHVAPREVVKYSYSFSGLPYAKHAQRFKDWQTLISDPALSRKFASQVVITAIGMIISGTYFGSQAEFDALNMKSIFPDHFKFECSIQSSFYSKNLVFTKEDLIPESTIDSFFQYLDNADKGRLIWFATFDLKGGAINDIAPAATAYGHRDALFYLGMNDVIYRGFPGRTLGSYAGYVDPELPNPQQRYFGSNIGELERLKSIIDPNDIIHNPQCIRPAK